MVLLVAFSLRAASGMRVKGGERVCGVERKEEVGSVLLLLYAASVSSCEDVTVGLGPVWMWMVVDGVEDDIFSFWGKKTEKRKWFKKSFGF